MLSILIPTYNHNCINLVQELKNQASALGISFEIIAIDDCSTLFTEENQKINQIENCQFSILPQNIGRAKIRNLLAKKAKYNNLLFIDCDAEIVSNNYLQRYISFCNETCVVCGGLEYDTQNSIPEFQLRLQYGIKREARNAMERQQQPYGAFSSFNFLIAKSIFNDIKFNEELDNYGHEDTLFGFELLQKKAAIYHIENALRHVGLESSEIFLDKTKQGVQNLLFISQKYHNKAFANEIKLLKVFRKIKALGLKPLFASLYKQFNQACELKLQKANPSLFLFDLYKLGYLCSIS